MAEKRSKRRGGARDDAAPALLRRVDFAAEQFEAPGGRRPRREALRRAAMERAALELSGEVGFARMTVAALVARSGSNLDRFYRTYADKEECYAAAYAAGIDELTEGAVGACASERRWADGMRAALVWLAELVESEPAVVKGLLGEAHAAGERTRAKRDEVIARLTGAIDGARRETVEPHHSPPPLAARFVLGGIEASVLRFLDNPAVGRFGEQLPGLLYVAVDLYLGAAAAREQLGLLGSTPQQRPR